MVKALIAETYHKVEEESRQALISSPQKVNFKTAIICIAVPLLLTFINYFGNYRFAINFLESIHLNSLANNIESRVVYGDNPRFYQLVWWVSVIIFFYLIPPLLIIKFWLKDKLSNYGLSFKGAFKDYKVYVIMLMIMVPLVLLFSTTSSFQAKYPFYNISKGEGISSYLLAWEAIYMFQFFALEFFFRGFMLHGTKHRFGFYSIFIMMIPYCMIHFGKPMPETIAAIIAGLALGLLSLKSKSIWLGVAIHCSVAITMDVMSLYQKGLLFS